MTSSHENDYRQRITHTGPTRFLPQTGIEIIHEVRLSAPLRHAVFDFDGTLSLIREGWPQVMIPMMVQVLQQTGTSETPDQLTQLVTDFVMELNGKQTIYQMIRLADEVRARGSTPADPLDYKHRYHELLMNLIQDRRQALRTGRISPNERLVPYSREILQALRSRNIQLYLASGTDQNFVREEVQLLGLTDYFGPHIYGALDDYQNFSKQMVIDRILKENNVDGSQLIGFGDGYVEIDNIKAAGGTAVAVASDEAHRSGKPDQWKRDRLVGVGADIVIPDFRHHQTLLQYLDQSTK